MHITEANLSQEQKELVQLAARIPESDIPLAKRFMQTLLVDPVWLSCATAPLDDEPVTREDEEAIRQAEASIARGDGIPHEEVLREFDSQA
ncbi:MAG: hypothetical protein HYZ37_18575 [Candidatus Solibacter usitatus]|nr:hypothetical protein [Candidatus Solibacter usitatus]